MLNALKGPVIGLGVIGLLTWLTHAMALELAAGHEIRTTGRRAIYKKALAWAAELLGPTGVLVVGGLLAAAMIAWAVVAVKNLKQAPKSA